MSDKININNNMMFRFGRLDTGTPMVSEIFGTGHPWIHYGINNDFPQELIRLYQNSSAMHSGLINRKVDMVAGNGFENTNDFIINQYSKDDLNVIAKKSAFDKVIFGGFYLNIIWSNDGTTISQIEHLPFEKMRIAKYNFDKVNNPQQLEGFYLSKDWLRWRRKENTPIFFPEYNGDPSFLSNYKLDTGNDYNIANPSQVMFFKTYSPGLDYYTLPYYNAALNYIKLEYEISTYHLKNVQNGLMPGMIIVNKSGIPTPEEREQIYNETKLSLSGAENAGDFIMVYAETPDKAPEFIPVQLNSSDQRFKDLAEQLDSTIMRAHSFTSGIAGIETSGKLGSAQEITEQLTYMQSTTISPIQNDIEAAFNKIAKINKNNELLKLKKYSIFDGSTQIQ